MVSCSPLKRIERIYMHHPELRPTSTVEIRETRDTLIIVRDTTIYVELPADTTYVVSVPADVSIDSSTWTITIDTLFASTNRAEAYSWVEANQLNLTLMDKDTTLEIRLENAIKESLYWYNMYVETTTVVPKAMVPPLTAFMARVGWFTMILLLIVIGLVVFKKWSIIAKFFSK